MPFNLNSYLPPDLNLDNVRKCSLGEHPPAAGFERLQSCLQASNDFRAPNGFHQSFGLVSCLHIDLGEEKRWKLLLDEVLRLLEPGGVFILRYRESPLLSGFELKSFLLKWTKQLIRLEFETRDHNGVFISTFRLMHTQKRVVTASDWTFGILTNGSRPENLFKFVESVRAIRGLKDFEIVVNGPRTDLGPIADKVRFLDPPDRFVKEGWITKKKNDIVSTAKFSNVLVAHDRYFLPEDFLERIEEFGADFDVLTARQETFSGVRFPDWVTSGAEWQVTPVGLLDYDDYSPYNYVNGGLILAKTEVLKSVPWNELLFWAQTEDVELSRRLEAAGYSHRLARRLVVKTTERPEYVLTFPEIPHLRSHYVLPARANTLPFAFYDGVSLSYGALSQHGLLTRLLSSVLKRSGIRERIKTSISQFKPQLISTRVKLYARYPRLAKRLDRLAQALYFEVK